MSPRPGTSPTPNVSARTAIVLAAAPLLVLSALLSVPTAAAAPPRPDWAGGGISWSNGVVLCDFAATAPTVAVSDPNVGESGLSIGMFGLSEVRPSGPVAAVADLAGLGWNVTNDSSDDAYDLAYSATAVLTASSSSSTPIGSVHLRVDFVLPIYAEFSGTSTTTVAVEFEISDWTWQAPVDSLLLSVGAWPTYATQEHLVPTSGPDWLLSSESNATGAAREQMGVASTALATPAEGPTTNVSATTAESVGPSVASLRVAFGADGAYRSLDFTAHVAVVLPSKVAGVPLPELISVGAAGVVVSVAVAISARRIRRRPSDLVYAEEEP
jgi:hypothetical protein